MNKTYNFSNHTQNGLYILGNDNVYEYLLTIFQSLRVFNQKIPAFLIPFDNNIKFSKKAASRFNIQIISSSCLEKLDCIAYDKFGEIGAGMHMFRKFCAFWGPLNTFLYLDADIAILENPEKIFQIFNSSNCQFLSFDCDETLVYKAGIFREKMQLQYNSKSFNAGAFVSRRGCLTIDIVEKLAEEAQKYKKYFVEGLGDQPFMNFTVDMSRLVHRRLPDVCPESVEKKWSDQGLIGYQDGCYRILNKSSSDYKKQVFFIHWAGHGQNDNFPNRRIFYHFRLLDEKKIDMLLYKASDFLRWKLSPLLKIIMKNLKTIKNYLKKLKPSTLISNNPEAI